MSYTIEELNALWHRGGRDKLASDEIDTLLMDAFGKATEIARLRAALEAVEWVFEEYAASCPWCERVESEHHGHATDCERQLALGIPEAA